VIADRRTNALVDRYIDLMGENIDLGLRAGELPDSSVIASKLATSERSVVASPAYLSRMGTPSAASDLQDHRAIVYTHGLAAEEWRFRRETTETSVRIPTRLSFSAAEGVREAVIAGLGLAINSRWMMEPELASGSFVPVPSDWGASERRLVGSVSEQQIADGERARLGQRVQTEP